MHKKLEQWLKDIGLGRNPDEYEAKQLARIYEIGVPDGFRLETGGLLNFQPIQFPCVIKLCSSSVSHKTEINGVALNNTKENISDNIARMRQRFPGKKLLVENQCEFIGPEIIIGIVRDESLGHAVMVGSGGIYTEIYNDTSFRLAPCTAQDALDMIDELKISPVFEEFRGIKIDKRGLAQTIVKVSRIAEGLGERLSQLDINPIVFNGSGWVALDMRVVLESLE